MKIFEILERYSLMNKLIKKEQTGSAKEFAKKLKISRSQLFNDLDYLKSYEIEIYYDPAKKSFVYENNVELTIHQPIRILKKDELESVNGDEKISDRVQGNWTGLFVSSLCA